MSFEHLQKRIKRLKNPLAVCLSPTLDQIPPAVREEAFAAFAEQQGLSRREAEVASYLLAGRTTSFAAEKLFIAESTVRAHVHSIYRKCGVHSRMELMDAFDECWSFKASDL